MTTDNFCFYSQNRLIQTSQTGGQLYSDTSPLVFPGHILFTGKAGAYPSGAPLHDSTFKLVKQEVNCTVILPPLVFPASTVDRIASPCTKI
jgi:hypothetical protein